MQTMRVRKGDLVHVLSGKDRGKQGHVIDARPKEGKVVEYDENLLRLDFVELRNRKKRVTAPIHKAHRFDQKHSATFC